MITVKRAYVPNAAKRGNTCAGNVMVGKPYARPEIRICRSGVTRVNKKRKTGGESVVRKPRICNKCPFGYIYYIDVKYREPDLIISWTAEPCSQVKHSGKINPARLQYCIGVYNRACRKAKEEDAERNPNR